MRKLSDIKNDINNENDKLNKQRQIINYRISGLKEEALKVLTKHLKSKTKSEILSKLVKDLFSSKNVTELDNDEMLYLWVNFDASKLINTNCEIELDLLKTYMQDTYDIVLDYSNNAALLPMGFTLLINEDGDVYDQFSGEFVILNQDYNNSKELNNLIKKYFKEQEVYYDVIKTGKYGVERLVDIDS